MINYELFIALRYLRARRRQAALSVITGIAIAGITLGVAALIIAQGLVKGFRNDVQEKILQGTSHINLLREDNGGIENYRELIGRLSRIPGIKSASATMYNPALLSIGDRQEQSVIKGIDTIIPDEIEDLRQTMIEGDLTQILSQSTPPEQETQNTADAIILGRHLAEILGLKINDKLVAISAQTRLTPAGLQARPRYTTFRVAGFFSTGLYEYDSRWAYVSLAAAQRQLGSGNTAGVIQFKVNDIDNVAEMSRKLLKEAGAGFMTTTWQELNRPLFAALQLQHRLVIVFFGLLIAIAALNIITTLTMTVIEKNRDIAILRAQGATPQSIRKIFMLQGLVIGIIGSSAGLALGLTLSRLANHYQWISIPAEIYSVSHITLKLSSIDCAGITGFAVLICLLATLIPSRTASRISPVEALRYE
ncbi:MAG: ABC transporter permease [Acidobacteria bacterium]|nr:ABC transporter permease [Acidobacteriota bacterium]